MYRALGTRMVAGLLTAPDTRRYQRSVFKILNENYLSANVRVE